MDFKIEPTEQGYLPNYPKYVLPPTPSGSSTDTAPSPPSFDHGEQNVHLYSGYYNTQLNNLSNNANPLENTQAEQDNKLNLEQTSFQMSADQYHPATQRSNVPECAQVQYQPNESSSSNPWLNQASNHSSDQLLTPSTPSSHTSTDIQNLNLQTKKRSRTQYSSFQILELERAFQEFKYLTRARKMELSKKLELDEFRIKVWYQNRRMKEKKNNSQETRTYKKRRSAIDLLLLSEASKNASTLNMTPVSINSEEISPKQSTSVTNRLLTHSVWAKGQNQDVSSALASYESYMPNQYHSVSYSPTLNNVGYSSLKNYYNNHYPGQHNHNERYFIPYPPYQPNIPTSQNQATIKREENFNAGSGLSSQDDLAINFAIAQEFLAKTMNF